MENTAGNTSYTPPISWQLATVRPQLDNTHIEHNQQSREDTKYAKNKPQTSLYNRKITGIQNIQNPNLNMHQPSGIDILQKICTTLTKYKTMQQDGPS